ncbi:hypothetical protein ACFX13_033591 [Malus domestica]
MEIFCMPLIELRRNSLRHLQQHEIHLKRLCLDQNLNFGLKEGAGPKEGPKGKIARTQSKPRRQENAFSDLVQLMKTICLPTQRPSGVD